MKAVRYGQYTHASSAFVSTNSICQGIQVSLLWPLIFGSGYEISFAYTSFKWANLASYNAGVTVIVIGVQWASSNPKRLFFMDNPEEVIERKCSEINAYLVPAENVIIEKATKPISQQSEMTFGNTPIDGGYLLLSRVERDELGLQSKEKSMFIRRIYGSAGFIRGLERYCLWIEDECLKEAKAIATINERIEAVRKLRLKGGKTAQSIANRAHQFQRTYTAQLHSIIIPRVSSENRPYIPIGLLPENSIVADSAFAIYDAPLWNMALIASKLHLVWIATVCGQLETRLRYSNTLGWNTFPLPKLTTKNKEDLTRCAEDILIARERHFPATIADLYDPEKMPEDLRRAHERNDEVLERIYIGRRFKNDTERLEKLFELYTEMTSKRKAE
jgi:hypothetical protein